MARRRHANGKWTDLHRDQLRNGSDHDGQTFGASNVGARRRNIAAGPFADDADFWRAHRLAADDFSPESMPLAEAVWHDLRNELIEERDHRTYWAFRRFEEKTTNPN